MTVYIVFLEDGSVHSVYTDKKKAEKQKTILGTRYENATIKAYKVDERM